MIILATKLNFGGIFCDLHILECVLVSGIDADYSFFGFGQSITSAVVWAAQNGNSACGIFILFDFGISCAIFCCIVFL